MATGGNASLETRISRVRLRDLKLAAKNARYFTGKQRARIVANIKQDGCLTSVPLVAWQDGVLTVVSGNNRVDAAIEAGIEDAEVMEVLSTLTREQFIGLQLSHNAVVGQDDPTVLKELYDELDFAWKEYSGLTEDAFKVEDLDTTVMRVEAPFYEEMIIAFLPEDAGVFQDWLARIAKSKDARARLAGRYDDFRVFFETLMRAKTATGVHNTAVALRLMAEMAGEVLDAREAEAEHEGA